MPKSLKVMIKKLAHDGKITNDECRELLEKLDGHDAEVYAGAYSQGYADGVKDGIEAME